MCPMTANHRKCGVATVVKGNGSAIDESFHSSFVVSEKRDVISHMPKSLE